MDALVLAAGREIPSVLVHSIKRDLDDALVVFIQEVVAAEENSFFRKSLIVSM